MFDFLMASANFVHNPADRIGKIAIAANKRKGNFRLLILANSSFGAVKSEDLTPHV